MEINIDASNNTLGRLGTYVAKQALLGNNVNVFNCEKIVISGSRRQVLDHWHHKVMVRGQPGFGPNFGRMPDRLVRRTIRGMLPWNKPRGREAFKRIMCYVGVPVKFKDTELTKVDISILNTRKQVTMLDISRELGAKI